MLPFADLVCFQSKMSELRRSQRLATDFSIARILATDQPSGSSSGPSGSSASSVSPENRLPKSPILTRCPCCPSLVISTQETKPFDPIADNRLELIDTSKNIDRQLDDRCIVNSDPVDETPPKNPVAVSLQNGIDQSNDLPWLHCTRYRPPRLPKRSSAGKTSKRRPGKHPRIPFTAFQLQILEDRYSKGAYLARRDVVQLSLVLRLPQSRVKIWFQNRRARDRRESLQSGNEAAKSDRDVSTT